MEERNCYVYEDYRIDNWTCCYVGMGSKNEEKGYNRFEVAERNEHHDNIMNSYGIARVIIRDNLTRKEANALEEARIYYYVFVLGYTIDIKGYNKGKKSDSHLTNQTWGGDGVKGHNPYANKTEEEMEEIRRKIGETWNNKTEEEILEWKQKMSEAHKGEKNPMYGRTGEKAPMYGKHHAEETKQKLSEVWSNKTEEEILEWKQKISEIHNKRYANMSEEERKEKHGHKGEKNPRARKVRCVETGEVFTTVKQACEWCGLKGASNIAKQIQKRQKSAGKHPITGEKLHWEYVIEQEEIEINLNLLTISNIKLNI